jgi:hypothetical protein
MAGVISVSGCKAGIQPGYEAALIVAEERRRGLKFRQIAE